MENIEIKYLIYICNSYKLDSYLEKIRFNWHLESDIKKQKEIFVKIDNDFKNLNLSKLNGIILSCEISMSQLDNTCMFYTEQLKIKEFNERKNKIINNYLEIIKLVNRRKEIIKKENKLKDDINKLTEKIKQTKDIVIPIPKLTEKDFISDDKIDEIFPEKRFKDLKNTKHKFIEFNHVK